MTTWTQFKESYYFNRTLNLALDYSRAPLTESFIKDMTPSIQKAFSEMAQLENGAISNPDEKRMVGHYWFRDPSLAPNLDIRQQIEEALKDIKQFADSVHKEKKFKHLLVVGIGGSALGPQFVNNALRSSQDPLDLYFFDNTDPDGMSRELSRIPDISKTIVVVISKSGGTKETRNGQLIAKEHFKNNNLSVSDHFVAVTGEGSELHKTAISEKWLKTFPMWDWIGGRTSELSTVGLVPASLQGFDINQLLEGAKKIDIETRSNNWRDNPAMIMALIWHRIGEGKGSKDMVILPYKDRFELFSRYLQQLVMESLGKELDLNGKVVNQGIAVYGNKGSTDQHAYVQQLREGVLNFFAVFIHALKGQTESKKTFTSTFEVEPNTTCTDYLFGFYQGTRKALFEKGRESITLTVEDASAFTVGLLIGLFERAVGFYASLININAYHQPGVEAGKKAATVVLGLQNQVLAFVKSSGHSMLDVNQVAEGIGSDDIEGIFHCLRSLSANGRIKSHVMESVFQDKYSWA